MTSGSQCTEVDPAGRRCVLSAGHGGVHQPPAPVIVKAYRGRSLAAASAVFQADAAGAAGDGFRPVAQSWQGPGHGGAILMAIVLVLIGLVFFGMVGAVIGLVAGLVIAIVATPPGTLTVTYTNQ